LPGFASQKFDIDTPGFEPTFDLINLNRKSTKAIKSKHYVFWVPAAIIGLPFSLPSEKSDQISMEIASTRRKS